MGILLTATLITRTPTYCTCGTLVANYEQEPYQKGLDTKGEQPCRLCPVAINKWMKIWVKNNGSYEHVRWLVYELISPTCTGSL